MVKKINKAAKEGKASKANETIITRKSCTHCAEKSSAATKEEKEVTKSVEHEVITSLMLKTKKRMKDLDVLHGKLYQGGENNHTFTEDGVDESEKHPWACFTPIVNVRPYARVSGNADGATLHIYVPEQNFEDTEDLVEEFSELFEKLMLGLSREDARAIIDRMKEVKEKMLKGLRWYRTKIKSAKK